ncbi:GNAT family N-acetyltransferase [Candidatus Cyanaurora vandensis]|uniref:GNAT family N-acetyltransferase n=1 Tax=Candidatus Cyanaurora vandensis TaxID=2714958 RepID=UPI002580166D|nr:GNAT family N-acetyltransferase [Candidatus Cyanaurora vandensis]
MQTTPLTTVRSATPADVHALARLLTDSFQPSDAWWQWTQGWVRSGLAQDLESRLTRPPASYRCLVATMSGFLAGTVEVAHRPLPHEWWWLPQVASPQDPLYISNLAVTPAWRRQGVASSLLQEVEAIARSLCHPRLYLHVMADNIAAVQLYQRSGYRLERVEKNWPLFNPRPSSKLLMVKVIM